MEEFIEKIQTLDTQTVIITAMAYNKRLEVEHWKDEWDFYREAIPLLVKELEYRFPYQYSQWIDDGAEIDRLQWIMPCEDGRDGRHFRLVG